jgi:membrane associated rhomboid family serine protease
MTLSASLRSLPIPAALSNPTRIRSYILRLPLFTRGVILVVLVFWILELQTVWSVIEWGSLKPSQIGLFTGGMYRLNTFVFVHLGFWHMLFNMIILVPLLERFEREFGTLTSVALFVGPLATIPAGLYLLIEGMVFRGDVAVVGARYDGTSGPCGNLLTCAKCMDFSAAGGRVYQDLQDEPLFRVRCILRRWPTTANICSEWHPTRSRLGQLR